MPFGNNLMRLMTDSLKDLTKLQYVSYMLVKRDLSNIKYIFPDYYSKELIELYLDDPDIFKRYFTINTIFPSICINDDSSINLELFIKIVDISPEFLQWYDKLNLRIYDILEKILFNTDSIYPQIDTNPYYVTHRDRYLHILENSTANIFNDVFEFGLAHLYMDTLDHIFNKTTFKSELFNKYRYMILKYGIMYVQKVIPNTIALRSYNRNHLLYIVKAIISIYLGIYLNNPVPRGYDKRSFLDFMSMCITNSGRYHDNLVATNGEYEIINNPLLLSDYVILKYIISNKYDIHISNEYNINHMNIPYADISYNHMVNTIKLKDPIINKNKYIIQYFKHCIMKYDNVRYTDIEPIIDEIDYCGSDRRTKTLLLRIINIDYNKL